MFTRSVSCVVRYPVCARYCRHLLARALVAGVSNNITAELTVATLPGKYQGDCTLDFATVRLPVARPRVKGPKVEHCLEVTVVSWCEVGQWMEPGHVAEHRQQQTRQLACHVALLRWQAHVRRAPLTTSS